MNILKKFCKEQGWLVTAEYIDEDITQEKKDQLKKAISEISNYDILLVKYGRYISRHTEGYIKLTKEIKDKGVKIYSVVEGWL